LLIVHYFILIAVEVIMKKKVIFLLMGMLLWVSNVCAEELIKIHNIKLTAYPHNRQLTSCGQKPSVCSLALPRTLRALLGIPCGTEAYVEEIGQWFIVEDTMSKKWDDRGDIFRADRWLPSVKACNEWGVVRVTIRFYVREF
jgi:3D (Asp-Asp-Asp) domain-containing protein